MSAPGPPHAFSGYPGKLPRAALYDLALIGPHMADGCKSLRAAYDAMCVDLPVHERPGYSSIRTLPARLAGLMRFKFGREVELFKTRVAGQVVGLTADGLDLVADAIAVFEPA